ncbi:MAG: hypothetical protein J0H71_18025 [Rhizobiales bacterium]|nr:hypothetical protein [Hyphomicrobiales bacterium]
MRTIESTDTITAIANSSRGTTSGRIAVLQDGGIIRKGSRGRHGGVEWNESECVSALLAVVLDHPHGADVADRIKRIRALPLVYSRSNPLESRASLEAAIRGSFKFVAGLSLHPLHTLGKALDAIVRDMRDGTFNAWTGGADSDVVCDFHHEGQSAVLMIDQPDRNQSAVFGFGFDRDQPSATEKFVRIRMAAFTRLAEAMGPP